MAEIDAAKDLLEQAGLDPATLFADRGDGYTDWYHNIASPQGREAAHKAIAYAVAQRAITSPWPSWWADAVEPMLRQLPDIGIQVGQRHQLVKNFTARMVAAGVDRFTAAGMAATWWEESFYELQTAASRGWEAVIDALLTTAEAGEDDKNAPTLADQAVIKLLAGRQLAERTAVADKYARLEDEIQAADGALSPAQIKELKSARSEAKRQLKAIDSSLLGAARETLDGMPSAEAPTRAIGMLRSRIEKIVGDHSATTQRIALAWYDNLANKYGTTLHELEAERDTAAARLNQHLKVLGYG